MGQRVLTDKNRNENRFGLHVSAQGRASTSCPAQHPRIMPGESEHERTPQRKVLALGVQRARLCYTGFTGISNGYQVPNHSRMSFSSSIITELVEKQEES